MTRRPLTAAHQAFRRWLGGDYDLSALNAALAAAAVARMDGDPLWLLLVSGSGAAKTETICSVATGAGALTTSTVASEGALLSATAARDRAKDATGGLLREIPPSGLLAVKDVTSILSQSRDARAAVLAALREVYDGEWTRSVGVDGARRLSWQGRLAVIGAVTTAWDSAHSVISACGDRFVLLRIDSATGRTASGRQALRNVGHEQAMRAELARAVASVMAAADLRPKPLREEVTEALLAAADVVTRARTGVEHDYAGNVIQAHAPEAPTRLAKQLAQVVRGGVAVGMTEHGALTLALRCARDCLPLLRLLVLEAVAKAESSLTTTQVQARVDKPRTTVDRTLQALHLLGLLTQGDGPRGWVYSLAAGVDLGALRAPPATRNGNPRVAREEGAEATTHDPSAKSGDPTAARHPSAKSGDGTADQDGFDAAAQRVASMFGASVADERSAP